MNRRISLDDVQSLQGVDNVIPLRPFCVFPHGNAVSRKSSLVGLQSYLLFEGGTGEALVPVPGPVIPNR